MRAADRYDYAVVRVVPRVDRGEFVNAGILLCSDTAKWLAARVELDESKLLCLDPTADVAMARRHLQALIAICAGTADHPVAALPVRPRFHWLTARRSAIIQMSPVHSGLSTDLEQTMAHLLDRLVRTPRER
jgi:hypothetical protein